MIGPLAARLAAAAALARSPVCRRSRRAYVETPLFAERVGKGELPPVARAAAEGAARRRPRRARAAASASPAASDRQPRRRGRATSATSRSTPMRGSSATTRSSSSSPTSSKLENEDDRIFTFRLREGHRWSDGQPFTTEDFRYYWEDVAHNKELSPAGIRRIHDASTASRRGSRSSTSARSATAGTSRTRASCRSSPQPRDPFIYRPAHYLKQFHAQIRRQGRARGGREEAEAEVLGGAAQPHGRHVREHQSGPADAAGAGG